MAKDSVTFLTGFPDSFLARSVLHRLLPSHAEKKIVCLVDPNQASQAEQALKALGPDQARVSMVLGEIFAMDFGLSGRNYLELARQVTVIHHCAATRFLGASRSEAKLGNVSATREVLELAEVAPQLQRLVYWSTALVSGKRRGLIREDELEADAGFRNSNEEMRFRAERMVRHASRSLPVTILRPSILAGDSRSGELDDSQGLFLLVRLMLHAPSELQIPLPALGDMRLHLVPVDYVAQAGCYLAEHPQSQGMTFHLVDSDPLSARTVFQLLFRSTGHTLKQDSLAGDVLGMILQFPGMQKIAPIPRAFLQQALTDVSYDSRNAKALLEGSGIECPSFDTYVNAFVNYVRVHTDASVAFGRKLRFNDRVSRGRA